jgi:hypothetical protein
VSRLWQRQGSALRRPLAAVGLVAAVAILAGATLGEAHHADAAGLPACARAHGAVALPRGLRGFPLPRGSVIDARVEEYGYVVVRGRIPGYINPIRDYLLSRAPAGGFRVVGGDAEAAEAEAAFVGHGGRGRWKVRELPGCAGALSLELAFRAG